MDFLQTFLANFIDKFKASNPKIYAIIAAVLIALQAVVQDPSIMEAIGLGGDLTQTITKWVLFFATLFVGSRTYEFKTK